MGFNQHLCKAAGRLIWRFVVCCHQYDDIALFFVYNIFTGYHSAPGPLSVLSNQLDERKQVEIESKQDGEVVVRGGLSPARLGDYLQYPVWMGLHSPQNQSFSSFYFIYSDRA